MRPRMLDLFCCQGGASAGYAEFVGRQLLEHLAVSERAA